MACPWMINFPNSFCVSLSLLDGSFGDDADDGPGFEFADEDFVVAKLDDVRKVDKTQKNQGKSTRDGKARPESH